jgi:hypothetical protein
MMRVTGTADTITTSANMADLQLQGRGVARQTAIWPVALIAVAFAATLPVC